MICPHCSAIHHDGQKFCAHCGGLLPATAASAQRLSRRQVTVLFCDLAESTALATQLDPEETLDVLAAYGQVVRDIAARFGGYVARIEGDGIDVYFGYPKAREEDAVRAIHAGLAIIDEVARLPCRYGNAEHHALQARVGIATGRVAVSANGPVAIAGTTPNLAARIQSVIRPGQVAVAPGTRRIAGSQFIYEELGDFALKGFTQPISIATVSAALSQDSRSAWRGRNATRMVARENELSQLLEGWQKTLRGQPAAALVVAEAGLGKSRLLDALEQGLAAEPHALVRLQCSPFHLNSALQPFVQHLRKAAGFQRHDSAAEQLQKLEAQLLAAGMTDSPHDAVTDLRLFARLLGIAPAAEEEEIALPPPLLLQLTQQALLRYLDGLSRRHVIADAPHDYNDDDRREGNSVDDNNGNDDDNVHGNNKSRPRPVLLTLEDMHWVDPTSLELLQSLLGQSAHVCIVMTARPEFLERFVPPASVRLIPLHRLDAAASREVAASMPEGSRLPLPLLELIIRKSDGVPLYIEELARMMLDSPQGRGNTDKAGEKIPDTLMDFLMERLDRLGEWKWLAQLAAVIGREFPRELLQAVAETDAATLAAGLDILQAAALVIPGENAEAPLLFRHALMEEAAYDSLPLKERALLHGRVAAVLIRDYPGWIERQPELAAHHLGQAGEHLQASHYWLQAGQQALGRGTPREAAAHLQSGVDGLARTSASDASRLAEFNLLSVLGPTSMVLAGPGSAGFGAVQKRAVELCQQIPGRPRQFPVTYGLCLYHWGRAELDVAATLSGQLLAEAGASPGDDERVMASRNMGGMVSFHRGDAPRARAHLEQSVARYDAERDAGLYPVYLMDFGVFGRFYLALASFVCGDSRAAQTHARDACELARRLLQPHTMGFALLANFIVAVLCNEVAVAAGFAEECLAFSSTHGFPEFVAMAQITRGWCRSQEAQSPAEVEAGLLEMESGMAAWQATGFENWQPWFVSLKAGILLQQGRGAQALTEIDLQLERIAGNGEAQFHSLLLAEKARILMAGGKAAQAESLFAEARHIAQAQGASAWQEKIEALHEAARQNFPAATESAEPA